MDKESCDGSHPLHQAAVRGGGQHQQMLDEGFDINEPDADGLTPLHMACINKNYGAAKHSSKPAPMSTRKTSGVTRRSVALSSAKTAQSNSLSCSSTTTQIPRSRTAVGPAQ